MWEATVLEKLKAFFTRHIVADVPDEIAACMECDVTECVEGKFRNCPNRLARVAALKALRANAAQEGNVTP
jgi:hypothetical protein